LIDGVVDEVRKRRIASKEVREFDQRFLVIPDQVMGGIRYAQGA
jgi:hypothetical protein